MNRLLILTVLFSFVPMAAHALCSNPAGDAGKVIYNAGHNVVQFCDGTNWIGMSGGSGIDNLGNHTATQILNMGSNRITNVTDPVGAQDVATKAYADTQAAGDNLGDGGTTTGNITITNTSPTLFLQDTDHNSGMIHMDANMMHFLSGSGVNSGGWAINGSNWPLIINMTTDDVVFGGAVHLNEGNLNMGTQAITSSAGIIRDASGGWVRTYGGAGWYNGDYDGGWYMTDGTWLRSYGSKDVFTGGVMRADGGFQVDGEMAISGTGQLNADSQTVTNVATPSAANDGANKAYADSAASGGSGLPTCPYKATLISMGGSWLCSTDPSLLTSCKAVLDAGLSTGDGTYSMTWNGTLQTMYCDMTTSGGGWTRVVDIPGPVNVSYNTVTTPLSTAQQAELARLDSFTEVLSKANTNLTGNVCGYGHSTQLSGLLYNGTNVSINDPDYLNLFGGRTNAPDDASASVVTAVSSLSSTRKNYFKTATGIRHNMHCWSGGGSCRQNCKTGSVSNIQIFYR